MLKAVLVVAPPTGAVMLRGTETALVTSDDLLVVRVVVWFATFCLSQRCSLTERQLRLYFIFCVCSSSASVSCIVVASESNLCSGDES